MKSDRIDLIVAQIIHKLDTSGSPAAENARLKLGTAGLRAVLIDALDESGAIEALESAERELDRLMMEVTRTQAMIALAGSGDALLRIRALLYEGRKL